MATSAQDRRDQAARARAEAKAAESRQRRIWVAAGAAVVVVGAALIVLAVVLSGGDPATSAATGTATAGRTTTPPWSVPAGQSARMKAADIRFGSSEMTQEHYHAHLDVIVDGKPVVVPAELGIDRQAQVIGEMHTHQTDGVIHIEAPDSTRSYTLGQFFTLWNVALGKGRLGSFTDGGGKQVLAYVDGTKVTGDPSDITLRAHQEVAVVYGKPGATTVPSSYTFAPGE